MCDSGGDPKYDDKGNYIGSTSGYGRHYERNKHLEFEKEPAASFSFDGDHIEYTRSVYHFLVDNLTFDNTLDKVFQKFAKLPENEDEGWLSLMEKFPDYLEEKGYNVDDDHWTVNTYNGECNLSQTLQYVRFVVDNTLYVLLQVHNGCDVRGGYTMPRVFQLDTDYLLVADGIIYCERSDIDPNQQIFPGMEIDTYHHSWYTDDDYHWYGDDRDYDLSSFESVKIESEDEIAQYKGKRVILYNDAGEMWCPICHSKMRA